MDASSYYPVSVLPWARRLKREPTLLLLNPISAAVQLHCHHNACVHACMKQCMHAQPNVMCAEAAESWDPRYKEAVNECTSALDVAPNNQKALLRRAKALEAMGLYKQALSDVQKVNKLDDAPPENQVGTGHRGK